MPAPGSGPGGLSLALAGAGTRLYRVFSVGQDGVLCLWDLQVGGCGGCVCMGGQMLCCLNPSSTLCTSTRRPCGALVRATGVGLGVVVQPRCMYLACRCIRCKRGVQAKCCISHQLESIHKL